MDTSGRAWVDDANVKVIEVVADFLAHGSSVEEMALQFPHLTPSSIHSALSYYYDHRETFEAELSASLISYRGKASAESPLRSRLSKASASL
jgi:uncharacterized protein (DUF433 family)